MALPRAAADYYRLQQRLTTTVLTNARRLWSNVGADFDAGWLRVGPQLTTLVSAGQQAAAGAADPYVNAVLAETGQSAAAVASVNARAFAGVAADGRRLDSLLYGAVTVTKKRTAEGMPLADALVAGGRWLDMTTTTTLADAGRGASSVAIAARPDVGGYTRMINPPACARCTVLAGRFYRWNEGFARHPRCDCRHIPASENVAGDLTTDPAVYFRSLSPGDQDRVFTAAGAQAIRDGADIAQVVNARRGLQISANGVVSTTSGTTRRAFAGRRMQANGDRVRLMPETIYQVARDRAEAIELLRRYGFLV